jgi:dTDP-glucose pyrophosphorylase
MKSIKNITINLSATIKDALKIIDAGAMQIALVVDDEKKLLGTLTDGDIRRVLLKEGSLEATVSAALFRNPTVCKVNDTKDQILKIAIARKLHQIPVVDLEGKLVGIYEIDDLLKPKKYSNKVVLMVGGLGSRLRPLTNERPKPLLEVGNKPILETIIANFSKHGFHNIILSVNYKSEMIKDYFGDGRKFGVKIEYINEEKRMGTAGALSLVEDLLTEPFFVMNGDLLTNVNFEHMLDFHIKNKAMATMGVREYDFQVPYGVVNINDHQIINIEEKPTHSFFVNAGMYILDLTVLKLIPKNSFYDMPTLFDKIIETNSKALSFPVREYWLDIGKMSDFEQANSEFHSVFT